MADNSVVLNSNANPAVYDKMVTGEPLAVADIMALSRAGVSDDIIIRYIRDYHTVYHLQASELENLVNAGVSTRVVNFVLTTPTLNESEHPPGFNMVLNNRDDWYSPWGYAGSYTYR